MSGIRLTAYRLLRKMFGRPAASVLKELEALPLGGGAVMDGPIMVLAPHPDDESLGCGGLIALAAQRNCPVHLIFMTDGAGSHPGSREYPPDRLRAVRESEALEAAQVLGLSNDSVRFLRWPDGTLPSKGSEADAIVETLVEEALRHKARAILSTWILDGHRDHVATAKLARRTARRTGARLYYFPIWGLSLGDGAKLLAPRRQTGFRLDISAVMPMKREAVARHRSQMTGMIRDSATIAPEADVFAAFERPYEIFVDARV